LTSLAGRREFCAATATMLVGTRGGVTERFLLSRACTGGIGAAGAGDMRPTRLAGCGPRSGSSWPMVAMAVEREAEGEYSDAPPHFTAVTVC
jgi:hypothetical protein